MPNLKKYNIIPLTHFTQVDIARRGNASNNCLILFKYLTLMIFKEIIEGPTLVNDKRLNRIVIHTFKKDVPKQLLQASAAVSARSKREHPFLCLAN
jgi:hypothetical protein